MANKNVFQRPVHASTQVANAKNASGSKAYSHKPEHELAQVVCTGFFADTMYVNAEDQLQNIIKLCETIDPEFIAKLAIYARKEAHMKDSPALLCAILSTKDSELFRAVFPKVIDNGKMLRNFVQIVRSGVTGRKSLGTAPKQEIQKWFKNHDADFIFRNSIGADPSLANVIQLAHVRPSNKAKDALFKYLLNREGWDNKYLPEIVKDLESFKSGDFKHIPDVPFLMLTSMDLTDKHWKEIARDASWTSTRMNLNTFLRHNVFGGNGDMIDIVADRLRNKEEIKKSKTFPYQLFTAYKNVDETMPRDITSALHDAMELSTENVPEIDGKVYVCVDVSGSMHYAVTGTRGSATTKMRYLDVAALIGATMLRRNRKCEVIAFNDRIVPCRLEGRDTILTNAERLLKCPSGGTDCHLPLAKLNKEKATGDLVLYVSDNESWVDGGYSGSSTQTMAEWREFKRRNPNAKMVCIDISPRGTSQVKSSKDVLNIGGFSDSVFDVIKDFMDGKNEDYWVKAINNTEIKE